MFHYTPLSSDSSTTFSWSRSLQAGISNSSANGTGVIIETLVNTTTSPITVTYEYVLVDTQGCTITKMVTVLVKPVPNLTSTTLLSPSCSGSTFNYSPTFSLAGSTYSWSRVPILGILPFTPAGGGGTSPISEVLTNTTAAALEVTYNFTATNGGCSTTSELKVQVEPSPSAAANITGPSTICVGSVDQEYSVALIPNATSYEWTLPTGANITSGLNTNVIKVTYTNSAVSGNITVKGLNSCGAGVTSVLAVIVKRNATVSLASGNSNTTLCVGSSFATPINYAITPSTEALTLTGTLPAGVTFNSTSGIITGTPTESGSFLYTIASSTACSNSLSGIIKVNPFQSISLLSGSTNQIACTNSAIDPITFIVASGVTNFTINPALPNGIIASLNSTTGILILSGIPTLATSLPQNYIVTTQGICGPVATANIIFDIKPAATITFLSSTNTLNQSICQNGPIVPIKFTIGGGVTGIVTPTLPAGLTIVKDLTGIYTIAGNPTVNGTFTIPITTTGCPLTENIIITNVNTVVSINLTSATGTDNQTQCQSVLNAPIVSIKYTIVGATGVTVTGLPTGVSYVYTQGTGELVISGTPTQAGIFNYVITTSPCSILKTGMLRISTPISITNELVTNVFCSTASNGTISTTIIGGVNSGGGYAVNWAGPNGFQQNQTSITGLEAGQYILTGTDVIGCPIPTKTYTVLSTQPINISLKSSTNVSCNGILGCANLNITGGSGIYNSFKLQFLDPLLQTLVTITPANNNYFNICNLKAGLYRLSVTDSNSCTSSTYSFTIYDYGILNIDTISLDDSLCANTPGKIRATVSSLDPNLTFYYNNVIVPHTNIGNNSYELTISNPSTPTATIKVLNQENCWDTKTITTTLISQPQLNYTSVNYATYGIISVNESVKFTNGLTISNIPAEYDSIVWDFGDNSPYSVFHNPKDINLNSSGESITTAFHTYSMSGLYPVKLTAYNHFGCSQSITKIVTVGQGAKIMLPTAFSPNHDGINDLFRPSLLGLKEVSMYIYDNWGNLIYEMSSDAASLPTDWGWNGIEKLNSEPVNGTYRYYIMAKAINDTIIKKEGEFILIK